MTFFTHLSSSGIAVNYPKCYFLDWPFILFSTNMLSFHCFTFCTVVLVVFVRLLISASSTSSSYYFYKMKTSQGMSKRNTLNAWLYGAFQLYFEIWKDQLTSQWSPHLQIGLPIRTAVE